MAQFVHLTRLNRLRSVLRGGIRPDGCGLYAMPVTENYLATHQWTRELMKWGRQPISAVYFRVDDNEDVYAGQYGAEHTKMSAAEAHSAFCTAEDPMGWECILERGIAPDEIIRTAPVRGVVGWRHFPAAHGRRPCPCCIERGQPGRSKMRRAWRAEMGDT